MICVVPKPVTSTIAMAKVTRALGKATAKARRGRPKVLTLPQNEAMSSVSTAVSGGTWRPNVKHQ